jgi:glycosyltransferase involved in cell wall biosynthesis
VEKFFKMKMPLVSITSAFHNEEAYLLDLIKSVFAQTFTDWELILVDDGSTDNSLQIARSINDPRIRVFTNGQNLGRSASLNKITTLARGKYIARFDADDMCGMTRIQKQVEFIESQPEVDAVGSGVCYIDRDDMPVGHYRPPLSHSEICKHPSSKLGILHGTILARKSWFERNAYDESLPIAVDFALLFCTHSQSTFANISEPLYYYRLDQSFNLKKQFCARRVAAKFLFEYYRNVGHWGKGIANWVIQYGKFVVTVLMFATGLRKKLMAKRYNPISDRDLEFYKQEISEIKNIELPICS